MFNCKHKTTNLLTQPFNIFNSNIVNVFIINFKTLSLSMERKEFLNLVGISVGAIILQNCMSGCSKAADPTPAVTPPVTPPTTGTVPPPVSGLTGNNSLAKGAINFSVDLTKSDFEILKTNGNALVSGDVIIARTKTGDFLVVEKACTHQGTTIDFVPENTTFKCPNHGSVFESTGNVSVGPAVRALKKYSTTFDGTNNILKVF